MSGPAQPKYRVASDKPFLIGLGVLAGSYLLIIGAMVLADLVFLDYGDQPILGNELVQQGRYTKDEVPVRVERGRRYQYRPGKNEAGLKHGGQLLTGKQFFTAMADEVRLQPRIPNVPITASLRPESKVIAITLTNHIATLTTDQSHGLLWGEFIRVNGAGEGWDGVHEITDTTTNQLSIALHEATVTPKMLQLSKPNPLVQALRSRDIQFSIMLSLISCTITTLLSIWVAVPIGYLMSRFEFRGKPFIDTLLDIPIVLPPLVVGLSLLILFRYVPDWLSDAVVYKWPAVVLAQFMVACAFAVRTMRRSPSRWDAIGSRRFGASSCRKPRADYSPPPPLRGRARWASSDPFLSLPVPLGKKPRCYPPAHFSNCKPAGPRGCSPCH